jgi:hypothetical protein
LILKRDTKEEERRRTEQEGRKKELKEMRVLRKEG